jgi:hypothetical protein
VTEPEILVELAALAAQAGLRVESARSAPGSGPEALANSGVCRVRGETWVVLVASDPVAARIELLARALREHAGPWLEGRYLPPALRDLLEADPARF